jgi:hypothetical protein
MRSLPYRDIALRLLQDLHVTVYGRDQLRRFIARWNRKVPVYRKHEEGHELPYTFFERKLRDIGETVKMVSSLSGILVKEGREVEKVIVIRAEVLLNSLLVQALDGARSTEGAELKRICVSHQDEIRYSLFYLLPRERRASLRLIAQKCHEEVSTFCEVCRRFLGDRVADFEPAVKAFDPGGVRCASDIEYLLASRSTKLKGTARFMVVAAALLAFTAAIAATGHVRADALTEVQQAIMRSGQFLAPLGGVAFVYSLYQLHRFRR